MKNKIIEDFKKQIEGKEYTGKMFLFKTIAEAIDTVAEYNEIEGWDARDELSAIIWNFIEESKIKVETCMKWPA